MQWSSPNIKIHLTRNTVYKIFLCAIIPALIIVITFSHSLLYGELCTSYCITDTASDLQYSKYLNKLFDVCSRYFETSNNGMEDKAVVLYHKVRNTFGNYLIASTYHYMYLIPYVDNSCCLELNSRKI